VIDVQQVLDALVPEGGAEFGDWDDVLARAGVRRAWRAVVAALVVVAAIAVPALVVAAVLLRTNVIFSHSKPAPNIVKKQFADLSLGAPPQFAISVQAARAREVGTFKIGGHRRPVWVAPMRDGGFCFMFERGFGGCTPRGPGRRILGATYQDGSPSGRWVAQVGGWIATRATNARIDVEYADGSTDDVPYVHVSAPISAGFFWFEVPPGHAEAQTRFVAISVHDGNGRRLAREGFRYSPHRLPARPSRAHYTYVARPLPSRSAVPPTEPIQRGTANGVSVAAGANGVALFDLSGIDEHARSLLAKRRASVSYGCFTLVRQFGIFDDQELVFEGRFAPTVAVRIFGLRHPWDGCEIQGSYGHLWPDRNGSHSAVEIPFTGKGRRYLADRAAARDLALFVHMPKLHRIRKLIGEPLVRRLSAYPIVRLTSADSSPPVGKIGYAPAADGVTFVERSPTGRRFFVEIRDSRIVRKNLKPYAFVF